MKHIAGIIVLILLSWVGNTKAQGPPITGDKPIMLGANRVVVKTLTEFRKFEDGFALRAPIMVHYLPTSNVLLGAYIPMVYYNIKNASESSTGVVLGDIEFLAKYQFFRKDGMGKTFRLVAKTLQTIPTGKKLGIEGMSTGLYQSYLGLVAGYESVKYGISSELGYNLSPLNDQDEIRLKLGFGLPLLKQTYPVNQVNLFFEYQNSFFVETNNFLMLYAQGLQYAKGRVTIEGAIQFPLLQTGIVENKRTYSVFFGMRYVI